MKHIFSLLKLKYKIRPRRPILLSKADRTNQSVFISGRSPKNNKQQRKCKHRKPERPPRNAFLCTPCFVHYKHALFCDKKLRSTIH